MVVRDILNVWGVKRRNQGQPWRMGPPLMPRELGSDADKLPNAKERYGPWRKEDKSGGRRRCWITEDNRWHIWMQAPKIR